MRVITIILRECTPSMKVENISVNHGHSLLRDRELKKSKMNLRSDFRLITNLNELRDSEINK